MTRLPILTLAIVGLLLIPALALAGATASSEVKDSWGDSVKMNANAAVDGDPATGWVEGNENDGVGEWIELDLPRGTLLSFTVIPGMGPDEREFGRYGVPNQVDIDIFSLDDAQTPQQVTQVTHSFANEYGPVTIDMGELAIGGDLWGGKARFTIRSVHAAPEADFGSLAAFAEIRATFKEDDRPNAAVIEISSNAAQQGNLVDEKMNTAWVGEGGAEEWVTIEAPDWSISSVGVFPGNASSSANWAAYARPKTLEVRVNMDTFTITLEDKKEMQWFELPVSGGYNGSCYGEVRLQVTDVYPGSRSEVAITELDLRAINYGG